MMKKYLLILLAFALSYANSSYAQIDAAGNTTAIGLGATSTNWAYKFTYQTNSIAHYGLGWYGDQDFSGGPMGYLAGYGGLKFFTAGTPQLIITNGGNVGIGTTSPGTALQIGGFNGGSSNNQLLIPGTYNFEQVKLGQTGNGDAALEFVNHTDLAGAYGIKLLADVDDGAPGLQFQYAPRTTSYASLNYVTGLYMSPTGNVGIGTTSPVSLFQVDEGYSKASIGDAGGSALNYGTSYLGFNASRSGSSWLTSSDGANNGGGVIYSSIFGDMYFSLIPRTGGSGQTLTDANIASNIAMRIDHTDGAVYAKQVYVQTSGWPDFVFKKDYALRPLSEVKTYIDLNEHLPDMPAAATVEKEGVNLGEMNKALLKKVEELTLYMIEKEKENTELKAALKKQADTVEKLAQRIDKLESKK